MQEVSSGAMSRLLILLLLAGVQPDPQVPAVLLVLVDPVFLTPALQALHTLSLDEYEQWLEELPLLNGPHQVAHVGFLSKLHRCPDGVRHCPLPDPAASWGGHL